MLATRERPNVGMRDQLIPDAEIPQQVEADGRHWLVIARMQNFHYRALLLPVGGGAPRWFSNAELRRQARRDERQLLRDTEGMDEHPEGYDGPCACAECRSYHAED